MVTVTGLTHTFRSSGTLKFPDFVVDPGEPCVLLGESGSGKTTLLHLMGGLLKIQHGIVQIKNIKLSNLSEAQVDKFRGKNIGYIFQKNHLLSSLSVKQNLLMAPYLADLKQDQHRLEEVLAQLGIWEKKNARIRELSQGQVQRVAIARAVLNKPTLIFADEPTSALDDHHCEGVISLLLNVASENRCTLLIATHDQRLKNIIPKQVQLKNLK